DLPARGLNVCPSAASPYRSRGAGGVIRRACPRPHHAPLFYPEGSEIRFMFSRATAVGSVALLVAMPGDSSEWQPSAGERQPLEAIITAVQQQGYTRVQMIEVRLQNCYDAVAVDKNGRRVELDVDPVSMQAFIALPKIED